MIYIINIVNLFYGMEGAYDKTGMAENAFIQTSTTAFCENIYASWAK